MPKLFVVRDQRNLAELGPALLKGRPSAALKESAFEAIRRANPSLDLDKLTPGTVVMLPPLEGARDTSSQDPAQTAAGDLLTRVRSALDSLSRAADSAEEQRVAERKEAQGVLGNAVVKRLSSQVPALAANLESQRAGSKDEDVSARKQLAALNAAQQEWEADLEVLRKLS